MSRREGDSEQRLSRAGVGRLSQYLRLLESLHSQGVPTVSSRQLGEGLDVTDAQVRRDLAYLATPGHPGVGYRTDELLAAIRRRLGLERPWSAVLVGVGNLARALLRYRGFRQQGLRIVGLFDNAPAIIGQEVDGMIVRPASELASAVQAAKAELAVLTVPAEVAQGVAEQLVQAGVRGLLNFAPVLLRVPDGVAVVSVDLTVQLEQLTFLLHSGG